MWIKIVLTPLLTVPLPPPVFTIACDQTTLTMLVNIVATLTVVSFAMSLYDASELTLTLTL